MPSLFVIQKTRYRTSSIRARKSSPRSRLPRNKSRTSSDRSKKLTKPSPETVLAELKKVDNISRFLLELKARREAIGREVERLEEISSCLRGPPSGTSRTCVSRLCGIRTQRSWRGASAR